MARSADAARAREGWAAIEARLDSDTALAKRVADALQKSKDPPRSSNRRAAPVLDPAEIYRQEPSQLRPALEDLDVEQLKDIVSHHAMDPRKLALKWKTADRLIELIAGVTEQRASKGSAFRA